MIKHIALIEKKLETFYKNLPNLPNSTKASIVKVLPWVALILGVFQIKWAFAMWDLIYPKNDRLQDILYLQATNSSMGKIALFVGVTILAMSAAILLMSYKPLSARTQKGWDLLFLATLLNVIYGVILINITGNSIGNLVSCLIASAIGFYLLFQVKPKYKKSKRSKR